MLRTDSRHCVPLQFGYVLLCQALVAVGLGVGCERVNPRSATLDSGADAATQMNMTLVDAGEPDAAARSEDAAAVGGRGGSTGESSTQTGTPSGTGGHVGTAQTAGSAGEEPGGSGGDSASPTSDAGSGSSETAGAGGEMAAAGSGGTGGGPTDEDPCERAPCMHGGACSPGEGNLPQCDCSGTGYTGPRCEEAIDECAGSPCMHGGVCMDEVGGYSCLCPPEWKGPRCETSTGCTLSDNTCLSGSYCEFAIADHCGSEGQRGTCAQIPAGCIEISMPVCGCDGQSYTNPCHAALRGVSVAHEGSCKTDLPNTAR